MKILTDLIVTYPESTKWTLFALLVLTCVIFWFTTNRLKTKEAMSHCHDVKKAKEYPWELTDGVAFLMKCLVAIVVWAILRFALLPFILSSPS